MTRAKPRLADVQCSRLKFEPGDRVIVRVKQRLDRDSFKKLRKSVERWAGDHVEVILIDTTLMEIEVDRATEEKVLFLPGGGNQK